MPVSKSERRRALQERSRRAMKAVKATARTTTAPLNVWLPPPATNHTDDVEKIRPWCLLNKKQVIDRVGVSFLFCNIHEGMNAVVVAVPTPYFGLSDHSGSINIPNVPDGRYQLQVWFERSSPEELKNLSRVVTISANPSSRSLEAIHIVDDPNFTLAHKNKYGEDYVPPPTAGYSAP